MTSKTLQARLKILRAGDYSGFSRWALNIIIRELTRATLDGQNQKEMEGSRGQSGLGPPAEVFGWLLEAGDDKKPTAAPLSLQKGHNPPDVLI